ncbi:MAG: tRNA (adenosine(37)-N6)-threonylcarbamoyltransferase complex transferase subunit TsaD [Minisyncoccia bacterium]
MKLLAIETSCDETAVAVLSCAGGVGDASFRILGNGIHSQIELHKEYGGVFPAMAKRAHAEHLVPMLEKALGGAFMLAPGTIALPDTFDSIVEREFALAEKLRTLLNSHGRPDLDAIAVTSGPGLEPALWVGVNFARALSAAWNLPLLSVNHMEGHFLAGLGTLDSEDTIRIQEIPLPVLGLLISGGHTELDLMRDWLTYELLGATRDDAVGEAFDKVARMMGLPYPGGPEISKYAETYRVSGASEITKSNFARLPRPMIGTDEYDFSFSGLKTAVLYAIRDHGEMSEKDKEQMACAFEDAVTDVLWTKTAKALDATSAKTLVLGGGVSANKNIARVFQENIERDYPGVRLRIPTRELTTDNAVMIGIAGYFHALRKDYVNSDTLRADGNLRLDS